jgi:PTS system galactitol-specific IIA component
MLSADLCVAGLLAESSDGVVRALAQRLLAAGRVRPSFEMAAVAREKRSPTGLPFPGQAVAMPHAEPEHVVAPAMAVASLAKPVSFRQMGAPGVTLDVSLVVMQDETLRLALVQAQTSQALYEILALRLGPG